MDWIRDILACAIPATGNAAGVVLAWLGNTWDKFLQSVSAVVVAGVALYGMIYTVIPLFSKAQLEEQKAQLEKEVVTVKAQKGAAESARDALVAEQHGLKNANKGLRSTNENLLQEQAALHDEIARVKADLAARFEQYERHNYYVNRPHVVRELFRRIGSHAFRLLEAARQDAAWAQKRQENPAVADNPYPFTISIEEPIYDRTSITGRDLTLSILRQSKLLQLLTESDGRFVASHIESFINAYSDHYGQRAFLTPLYAPLANATPMTQDRIEEYLALHNETHEKFAAALQLLVDVFPMTFTGFEVRLEDLDGSGRMKKPVPEARPGTKWD